MTARRFVAIVAATTAALVLAVAATVFVRVRALDAEAQRLGLAWAEDPDDRALVAESNEHFAAARRLEDLLPLAPVGLGGVGLVLAAASVAAWPHRSPGRREPDEADTEPPGS